MFIILHSTNFEPLIHTAGMYKPKHSSKIQYKTSAIKRSSFRYNVALCFSAHVSLLERKLYTEVA